MAGGFADNPAGRPSTVRYTLRTLDVVNLERETVSITEACRHVGVTRRTIYNWMADGKIEYVRTAGGAVRIFTDTLWRSPGEPARRPAVGARRAES